MIVVPVYVQQGDQPPSDKLKHSRSRNLDEPLSETDTLVRHKNIQLHQKHFCSLKYAYINIYFWKKNQTKCYFFMLQKGVYYT